MLVGELFECDVEIGTNREYQTASASEAFLSWFKTASMEVGEEYNYTSEYGEQVYWYIIEGKTVRWCDNGRIIIENSTNIPDEYDIRSYPDEDYYDAIDSGEFADSKKERIIE